MAAVSFRLCSFVLFCSFLQLQFQLSESQFPKDSGLYNETYAEGEQILRNKIESDPDVEYLIHPQRQMINTNQYFFIEPQNEDYIIGLILDPCRSLPYDCCLNVFGSPEYMSLRDRRLEAERAVEITVLASESEITENYIVVDERSNTIPRAYQRRADDESYLDPECISLGNPHTYCLGKRYAKKPSSYVPACVDNNSSLNVLDGCYDIDGNYSPKCVQVGFTENAFIPQCGGEYADDPHCGTFLEIHIGNGTPYHDENTVISSTRITVANVSGYYTTTIPLTWQGDESRVLCAYSESYIRVGSMVYITPRAPVCCCPPAYLTQNRTGSFFCPKGRMGNGPYGGYINKTSDFLVNDISTLTYPYCRSGLNQPDKVMCAHKHRESGRYYTKECAKVYNRTLTAWTSEDLHGKDYNDVCPYFDTCALSTSGSCGTDHRFTFTGRVGKVVAYDPTPTTPLVTVSFNDGRTSYVFEEDVMNLEYYKSMYEIWWVTRTRSKFIVEKRKGFNVTFPGCTYDVTNDRYFPWSQLDDAGKPID